MKTKDLNFDIKAVSDDGFFSGYGSVFDVIDSYGDIVRKGAFEASINDWKAKGKMPPILWNHKSSEPIGVYTDIREDEKGLYVEGKLLVNDVQRAKETHALLKNNAISGLSIGYSTKKYAYSPEDDVTDLLELKLWEVSVVTFPANEESIVELVKNGVLPSLKEFENFLRESGFSKSQAVAIASHGLRKLRSESDTDEKYKQILDILKN